MFLDEWDDPIPADELITFVLDGVAYHRNIISVLDSVIYQGKVVTSCCTDGTHLTLSVLA